MSNIKSLVFGPKNEQLVTWGLVSLAIAVALSILTRSVWAVEIVILAFAVTVFVRSSKWPVFTNWLNTVVLPKATVWATEFGGWLKVNLPIFLRGLWRFICRLSKRFYYHFLVPLTRAFFAVYLRIVRTHPVFGGVFLPGVVISGIAYVLWWLGMRDQHNGGITFILGMIGGVMVVGSLMYGFYFIMDRFCPIKKTER